MSLLVESVTPAAGMHNIIDNLEWVVERWLKAD